MFVFFIPLRSQVSNDLRQAKAIFIKAPLIQRFEKIADVPFFIPLGIQV